MMCRCGHGLDSHGDRALPVVCESDKPGPPLHRYVEGQLLISHGTRYKPDTACSCRGFERE